MRTYLAERIEPGDEGFVASQAFNPEFIQASVAFALYRTIEGARNDDWDGILDSLIENQAIDIAM